jgi:hypothetical protein
MLTSTIHVLFLIQENLDAPCNSLVREDACDVGSREVVSIAATVDVAVDSNAAAGVGRPVSPVPFPD